MQFIRRRHIAVLAVAPVLIGAVSADSETSQFTRLALTGTGFAEQEREYMAISAMTETFSTRASEAVSDDARKMDRLRETLKRLGVQEADFRTSDFRFGKDRRSEDDETIEGYTVRHSLAITMRDTGRIGPAFDALVDAGAENLSMGQGYGYNTDLNPTALRQARAAAIADAMTKAADYAHALDMRVLRVVSVNDGSSYVTDRPMPVAAMRADVETQIDTRPAALQVSVQVVFDLGR
jgi:uncharacterized protein